VTWSHSAARKRSVAVPLVMITCHGWALHQDGVRCEMLRIRAIRWSSTGSRRNPRQLWRVDKRHSRISASLVAVTCILKSLIRATSNCRTRRNHRLPMEGNHPRHLNRGTETRHRFYDEILETEEALLTDIALCFAQTAGIADSMREPCEIDKADYLDATVRLARETARGRGTSRKAKRPRARARAGSFSGTALYFLIAPSWSEPWRRGSRERRVS
jgi:hypothetical protein